MSDEIAALVRRKGEHLGPGAGSRSVCPFCLAEHEKSFSVIRGTLKPYLLFFHCFRGTCAASGTVVDREGARLLLSTPVDEPVHDGVWPEYDEIPREFLGMLVKKYGTIPFKKQGAKYDDNKEGLCMPWLDHLGGQIGWIEKRFNPEFPKSHHNLVNRHANTRLAFPRLARSYTLLRQAGTAVLVEDLISAYKLLDCKEASIEFYNYYPVSLNGAQISNRDAALIGNLFSQALVLLDPDQFPKGTMRVMQRLRPYCDVRGTTLSADPKDCPRAEIVEFFNGLEDMY